MIGQRGICAKPVTEHLHRIIDNFFLAARAVLLQHLTGVAVGKDRLDPRTDVPGIKRDRPRGRDRGQQGIADTVFADRGAHVLVHVGHVARGKEFLGVEQRESPLFPGQIDRGKITLARDQAQPAFGLRCGLLRAIAQPAHQQRIGKPGYPQPDPALVLCLFQLLRQGKPRGIHDVVHHPHGGAGDARQCLFIDTGLRPKRILHQPGKVDRSQKAGAIGRQRLLTTRVRGSDRLAIAQVVGLVDPVNENDARFCIIIGRPHDAVPQIPRLHRAVDPTAKDQIP